MTSGIHRAVLARLAQVGGSAGGRTGLAGVLLATLLVAASWLVSPAPQVDAVFLRFLALSTTCEMLLWLVVVLVTRRPLGSSALCGLAVGAIIVTNNLKREYTGMVALPIDAFAAIGVLYDLRTFLGYIGYHIVEAAGLVGLGGLVVLGFVKEPVLFSWSRRSLAGGAVYIAAVAWFYYPVTSLAAPVQRLYRAAGAAFNADRPSDSVEKMGLFAHLLTAAPEFFPTIPVDYGDQDLFLQHFHSTAGTGPTRPVSSSQPNIVVVLSESLFDPRRLNVSIDPPVLTGLDDLSSQADYHGTLIVHTIGGGTVRAEYSLLTGIPTTILGQGGQWPFYSLVTESTASLARYLGSIGYHTVAVYPSSGSRSTPGKRTDSSDSTSSSTSPSSTRRRTSARGMSPTRPSVARLSRRSAAATSRSS